MARRRASAIASESRLTAPGPMTFPMTGSEDVEHRADDANPGVAQLPDETGRIAKASVILAREHDGASGPESNVQRVGVELRGRRIEQDDVEVAPHLLQ